MTVDLTTQTDEQLAKHLADAETALENLPNYVASDEKLADAIGTVISEEDIVGAFGSLVASDRDMAEKLLFAAMGALVHLHTTKAIGHEISRRAAES